MPHAPNFIPPAALSTAPLRVYFAGRWGRRDELRIRRDAFQGFGVVVTSSWLDEASHQNVPDDGSELPESPAARAAIATRDLADLAASDVIVAFTEDPRSPYGRGGRHIELGVALGLRKLVWIVGPRENVHCWLPQVRQFDDFDGLLGWYWEREKARAAGYWVSRREMEGVGAVPEFGPFDYAGPAEAKMMERAAVEEREYQAKLNAAAGRYGWRDGSFCTAAGSSPLGEVTLEKIQAAQAEMTALHRKQEMEATVTDEAVEERLRSILGGDLRRVTPELRARCKLTMEVNWIVDRMKRLEEGRGNG